MKVNEAAWVVDGVVWLYGCMVVGSCTVALLSLS